MPNTHVLTREIWLNHPREDVFDFFSDAYNLDNITPPWLNFRILTPRPIPMAVGTRITYRLKLRGIPIRWLTEITAWEPPHYFVDSQLKGPYRKWVHEHRFIEQDGGTLMQDRVEYAVPGWIFEPLIHGLFVRTDVETIFDYRQEQFARIFRTS